MKIKPKDLGLTTKIMKHIADKENYLEKRCTNIWFSKNRNNEEFLFGKFGTTVVTIAQKLNNKLIPLE